jgi:hypothetical protein
VTQTGRSVHGLCLLTAGQFGSETAAEGVARAGRSTCPPALEARRLRCGHRRSRGDTAPSPPATPYPSPRERRLRKNTASAHWTSWSPTTWRASRPPPRREQGNALRTFGRACVQAHAEVEATGADADAVVAAAPPFAERQRAHLDAAGMRLAGGQRSAPRGQPSLTADRLVHGRDLLVRLCSASRRDQLRGPLREASHAREGVVRQRWERSRENRRRGRAQVSDAAANLGRVRARPHVVLHATVVGHKP